MAEIKYSPVYDIKAPILDDYVPEGMLKIYPYELVNTDKSKAFMMQNAVSVAIVSQANLDTTNEILKVDDNGNKYFEVYTDISSDTIMDITSSTSVFGQELKEEDSFMMLSNWYYEGEFESIKLGQARLIPAIFTVGVPFDATQYEAGTQPVFVSSSMIEAKEGMLAVTNDIQPEGLYEWTMVNITNLEASFTNARILFRIGLGNEFKAPKIKVGGTDKSGISVEIEKTSLIGGIMAKGNLNGKQTDIDFNSVSGLTPFKMTSVSTQDKVTMFADWFDYDVVMPEFIATQFITGSNFDSLKQITMGGQKRDFLQDDERNLIYDAVTISYLFGTNFATVPRYTAQEAKDSGGGAKMGDIHGNTSVGSVNWNVAAIAAKDPIKVIDSLFDNYQKTHYGANEDTHYLAVKEFTVALSRYIYSTYSIGKGQNNFNEVYLPWFLRPTGSTPINFITKYYWYDKNGVALKNSTNIADKPSNADDTRTIINLLADMKTTFTLFSRYFDVSGGTIKPKSSVNISEVKVMQTDRKITLPVIPDIIGEISKLPLPGDVDTTSSRDIQYIWYLPIADQQEFSKLFLNNATVTTNNTNRAVKWNTAYTDYGKKMPWTNDAERRAYILSSYLAQNPGVNAVVTDMGAVDQENSAAIQMAAGHRYRHPSFETVGDTVNETWFDFVYGAAAHAGFTPPSNREFTRVVTTSELEAEWLRVNKEVVEFTQDSTLKGTGYIANPNFFYNFGSASGSAYFKVRERLINTQLTINGNITTVDMSRDVTFDKNSWRYFMNDYLAITSPTVQLDLIETRNQTIDSIDELIITSMWSNEFKITLNGVTLTIPSFNKDNETIAIQRILFT